MIRITTKYTRGKNTFETNFTVFKPEVREKSIRANLTTSRKCDKTFDKKIIDEGIAREFNGEFYVSSNWNAIFIGEAYNKAVKYGLEEKQRITNVIADLQNEPYITKDGNKVYNNPTLKIIDFDFYENNKISKGMDTPPKVEEPKVEPEVDPDELPF